MDNKLKTVDAETLLSTPMSKTMFIVDGLISQGVNVISGASKIGKSWLMLWLGHSDFTTTANIYAHLDYRSKISSAQAMKKGMFLPGSDDFGSRWEDMTDQGEDKEPDMNSDSD